MYSVTITGLIVFLLTKFFVWVGIGVGETEIATFVNVFGQLIAGILVYWGRIRKGDLNWFGGRKII